MNKKSSTVPALQNINQHCSTDVIIGLKAKDYICAAVLQILILLKGALQHFSN